MSGTTLPPVVVATSDHYRAAAEALAQHLGLELVANDVSSVDLSNVLRIIVGDELAVLSGVGRQERRISVDFAHSSLQQRVKSGSKDLLVRACGLHKAKHNIRRVMDATAGFGADAWVLASQGVEVIAIEQDVLVTAMLENALKRAQRLGLEGAQKLTIFWGDSVLMQRQEPVDIVYLDPMFSGGRRKAASSKSMSFLQDWLAHRYSQQAHSALFDWACKTASSRVVVKRGIKATPLSAYAPTFQIKGKTHRFDVYQLAGDS